VCTGAAEVLNIRRVDSCHYSGCLGIAAEAGDRHCMAALLKARRRSRGRGH
jgi:hypothetical protein